MIRLAIKKISSPDVEIDTWMAANLREVFFLLELEIGDEYSDSADLFQVIVATPEGLGFRGQGNVISDRGLLVLSAFSWTLLRDALGQVLEKCTKPDWPESVLALQRYCEWEYEDYVQTT